MQFGKTYTREFFKDFKLHSVLRTRAISIVFEKLTRASFFPNCTRNHTIITYTNSTQKSIKTNINAPSHLLNWSRENVSQHKHACLEVKHACLEVKFGFLRSIAYGGSVPGIFSSMYSCDQRPATSKDVKHERLEGGWGGGLGGGRMVSQNIGGGLK